MRRQDHRRVAGMDAGFLYMLHYPAYYKCLSVAYHIYVDFDGVLEEFIYQDRKFRRGLDRVRHIILQGFIVIDYLHSAPAQHIRRPDHYRIAYPLLNFFSAFDRDSGAVYRLP